MMNYYKKLFFVFGLAALLFVPHVGQAADPLADGELEHISSFDSNIVVHADSSIDVTETIKYDFGNLERHGIYRDIPLTMVAGAAGKLKISNVNVTDEKGRWYPIADLSYASDGVHVKVGDANQTITGIHQYIISYHVLRAIGYFDSFDEIYWNVTGNQWTVPISFISASVILPGIIPDDKLQFHSYCGAKGSTTSCGSAVVGSDGAHSVVSFSADGFDQQNFFDIGEGMTVAVGFPKGIVATIVIPWWQKEIYYDYAALGIIALFFLRFVFWIFFTYFKEYSKRKRPIIAEYEPPEGMSPSVAGGIYSKWGLSVATMATADILYLASLGYITIEGSEGKAEGRANVLTRSIPAVMVFAIFTLLLSAFVSWKFVLPIALLIFVAKYKIITKSLHSLLHPMQFKLSRTKVAGSASGHVSTLYSLVTRPDQAVSLSDLETQHLYSEFDSYKLDVDQAVIAARAASDPDTTDKTKNFALKVFLSIVGAVGVFIVFSLFPQFTADIPTVGILAVIGAVVVSLVIFGLLYSTLERKLSRMSPIWYQVAGLREYIKVAEKDRIKFESNPEDSLRIFSTLLPYAVAFGLEDRWASVFGNIIPRPPEWYHGTSGAAFSAGTFVSSIHTFSNSFSMVSNAGRPAPTSGGSGGGGFSGGGGGGGGGGSW